MSEVDVAATYKNSRKLNCHNMYQGRFKRVLCVCSAGLLRSPTAAFVLSQEPYNFNTRAAGLVPIYALVPVDDVLLEWAEEIICMETFQAHALRQLTDKKVICLNIPDNFEYRNDELMAMIRSKYDECQKESK